MIAKGNLAFTISFSAVGVNADGTGSIVIELNNEKNEGKTTFKFGDIAYFYIISDKPYQVEQSDGEVSNENQTITLTLTESLTFAFDISANVSKAINSIVSTKWYGKKEPAIKYQGNTVSLGEKSTGTLEITYTAMADSWYLENVQKPSEDYEGEYPVVIVAYQEE